MGLHLGQAVPEECNEASSQRAANWNPVRERQFRTRRPAANQHVPWLYYFSCMPRRLRLVSPAALTALDDGWPGAFSEISRLPLPAAGGPVQ